MNARETVHVGLELVPIAIGIAIACLLCWWLFSVTSSAWDPLCAASLALWLPIAWWLDSHSGSLITRVMSFVMGTRGSPTADRVDD